MSAPTRIDRYLVFDAFARGGSASVHLARLIGPAGFSRIFAIKRLHRDLLSDPSFEAMLIDEARLVSRVRHPNVVPIFEVISAPGELLLVLEYIPGLALSQLLRLARERQERVPVSVLSCLMCDVLAGLHAAHEAVSESGEPLSVVHRDVSPQNILVGSDGAARMVDFGIALATERLQHTRTGELKGKLCYMAPEQVRRRPVDRRTDVFGAGAVLWEGLVGERLFDGEDELAVLRQVADGAYRTPRSVQPAVPEALDAVAMRALSLLPGDRFATAAAMAAALEAAAPRAPVREVAAWVARIGARQLAEGAALVTEVEGYVPGNSPEREPEAPASRPEPAVDGSRARSAPPADVTASYTGPVSLPPARAPAPALETVVTSADAETVRLQRSDEGGGRRDGVSARIKLVALASSGALLVFMAIVATAVLARRTPSPRAVAPSPVFAASAARPAAASASGVSVPVAAPGSGEREAGADSSAPPARGAAPPHPVATKHATRTHRTPPPSAAPSAKSTECRTPYYLDKDGVKVPKLQCLH
jgi:serine/threonine-protein kinase